MNWKEDFRKEAERFAELADPFTTEDVMDKVGPPPEGVFNSAGRVMQELEKEGTVVKTGQKVRSRNPKSKGSKIWEWRGKPKPTKRFDYTTMCGRCFANYSNSDHEQSFEDRIADLQKWEFRHVCARYY